MKMYENHIQLEYDRMYLNWNILELHQYDIEAKGQVLTWIMIQGQSTHFQQRNGLGTPYKVGPPVSLHKPR